MEEEKLIEEIFCSLLVEKKLLTERKIAEVRNECSRSNLNLPQFLLKKKIITTTDFVKFTNEAKERIITCPKCEKSFDRISLLKGRVIEQYERIIKCGCPYCGYTLDIPFDMIRIGPDKKAEGGRVLSTGKLKEKFGRFEILEEVGKGGMGVVYKAYEPLLKRIVALKVLRYGSVSERETKRFKNEAETLAKLNHPNIVSVFEVGVLENVNYFTMEYVEGTNLEEKLRRRKRLSEKEAVAIMEEIAQAVDYAHKNGIIHRDLKPSNIIITKQGRPKLTDFGLAKAINVKSQLTLTGETVGTPYYMAPEQITAGSGGVDRRTDVYALGVILYQMLTGTLPFTGNTTSDLYYRILNSEVKPLRRYNKAVSKEVETICLKALSKDKKERFATAEFFANDLRRFLEGEPIKAKPSGVAWKTYKKLKKHKMIVGITLVASIAILLSLFFYFRKTEEVQELKVYDILRSALINYNNAEIELRKERCDEKRVRKEMEEGYKKLQEALSIKDDELIHYYIARHFFLQGKKKRTIEYCQSVLARKEYPILYAMLGRMYIEMYIDVLYSRNDSLKEEYLKKAREALNKMQEIKLEFEEKSVKRELSILKGIELYVKGDYKGAIEYLKGVLIEFENRDEFYGWIGFSYFELGNDEKATEYFSRPVEENKRYARGFFGRGNVYYRKAEGMKNKELKEKYLGLAEDDFGKTLAIKPNFAEAYLKLGLVYSEKGEYEKAFDCYDTALLYRDDFVEAFVNRALEFVRKKDFENAFDDYAIALKIKNDFVEAYVNRGKLYLDLGKYDEAISDFNTAEKINPNFVVIYINRGSAYHRKKDFQNALKDFSRAIALNDKISAAYYNRGLVYDDLKEYDKAIEDFNKAIQLDSEDAASYHSRGVAYYNKKDYENAMKDFETAIKLDDKHVNAYVGRGVIYATKNQFDKAIENFSRAIELDKTNHQAYFNRGWLLFNQRKYREALDDFNKAIELNPELKPQLKVYIDECRKNLGG